MLKKIVADVPRSLLNTSDTRYRTRSYISSPSLRYSSRAMFTHLLQPLR
ncbi:hypothetical protein [Nostoc sp. TCL26-01]|nr:hypothetical protein [Nostoc sp. TCL26-01]